MAFGIKFEILYSDLTHPETLVATTNNIDALSNVGVLAVAISQPVNSVRVPFEYKEKYDNYILAINNTDQLIYLGGWNDNEGGWYLMVNPFASNGYSKSTRPPHMLPYQPGNWRYWVFAGEEVTAEEWDASLSIRQGMQQA